MRCVSLLLLCSVAVALLTGCVASGGRHVEASAAQPGPAQPNAAVLAPGDRLHVIVYGEDRLTGDYDIDGSGAVSLPLTGPLKAAGLTQLEVQGALAAKLRSAYLKDPRVTVATLSVRPFYILGEVEKPGEYPYRSGLDIWRAMALAGGQTYRASASTVAIQRAGENEFHDYKLAADVTVGPGDVVRVPERWF